MHRSRFTVLLFLLALGWAETAAAQTGPSGLPLPRFVSLRASEVNMRTGPGIRYPIEWVYRRSGLPVEVVDEFDTWRRIRDWEGTTGWVHQSMLQRQRTLRVIGEARLLRREPEARAAAVARLEVGAIGRLGRCQSDWCEAEFSGFEGYLHRDEVYGIRSDEAVE